MDIFAAPHKQEGQFGFRVKSWITVYKDQSTRMCVCAQHAVNKYMIGLHSGVTNLDGLLAGIV